MKVVRVGYANTVVEWTAFLNTLITLLHTIKSILYIMDFLARLNSTLTSSILIKANYNFLTINKRNDFKAPDNRDTSAISTAIYTLNLKQ